MLTPLSVRGSLSFRPWTRGGINLDWASHFSHSIYGGGRAHPFWPGRSSMPGRVRADYLRLGLLHLDIHVTPIVEVALFVRVKSPWAGRGRFYGHVHDMVLQSDVLGSRVLVAVGVLLPFELCSLVSLGVGSPFPFALQ